jgi:hypothetical protein
MTPRVANRPGLPAQAPCTGHAHVAGVNPQGVRREPDQPTRPRRAARARHGDMAGHRLVVTTVWPTP